MSTTTWKRHKERWEHVDMVMDGVRHMPGEFTAREVSDWVKERYGKAIYKSECSKAIMRFAVGVELGRRGNVTVYRKVM